MKTIIQAMLEEIYFKATDITYKNEQRVGEKNDYYITMAQLEKILKGFEDLLQDNK
jgi:hypothetical protein